MYSSNTPVSTEIRRSSSSHHASAGSIDLKVDSSPPSRPRNASGSGRRSRGVMSALAPYRTWLLALVLIAATFLITFQPIFQYDLGVIYPRTEVAHNQIELIDIEAPEVVPIPEDTPQALPVAPTPVIEAAPPDPYLDHMPMVVVGDRQFEPRYSGCSSTQLLHALKGAVLRPDGASRNPLDYSIRQDDTWTTEGFEMSFDLPDTCPPPHVYNTAEACDLLKAYGGVTMRGDSLVRHVMNALMIILSGKHSGAAHTLKDRCRGDTMFDWRAENCREGMVYHSEEEPEPPCGGDVWLDFELEELAWKYDATTWENKTEHLPIHKRFYSPVVFMGVGLWFQLDPLRSINWYLRPMFEKLEKHFPRPVGLWSAVHPPAWNKPAEWIDRQGPIPVKKYNDRLQAVINRLSPNPIIEEGGGMKMMDWWGMSDGATSYDGTHYSYQVNMEKAMMFLNLLDLVWTEAKDAESIIRKYP